MLARTRDAAWVNATVNQPDVRPFIGGEGYLDLSAPAARDEHLFLLGQYGGFGLIWTAPHAYEVHTFIARAGRGRWARDAASFAIRYATDAGARTLWTKIPPHLPHVRLFAGMMGMCDTVMRVEEFGKLYAVYSMEIDRCPPPQLPEPPL